MGASDVEAGDKIIRASNVGKLGSSRLTVPEHMAVCPRFLIISQALKTHQRVARRQERQSADLLMQQEHLHRVNWGSKVGDSENIKREQPFEDCQKLGSSRLTVPEHMEGFSSHPYYHYILN